MIEKQIFKEKERKQSNVPILFGIRHLSPAGAWHLRKLLDRVKPEIVLVEGPSDFNEELSIVPNQKVKPPFAMLAYTKEPPIDTILYPLSVYSPEYQAILWAYENKKQCRFIDLPSGAFLAFSKIRRQRELEKIRKWEEEEEKEAQTEEQEQENTQEDAEEGIYQQLDRLSG